MYHLEQSLAKQVLNKNEEILWFSQILLLIAPKLNKS